MAIQLHTNVELIFGILKDQLKTSSELTLWQVEVRFEEGNSDAYAQILSLLLSDNFFHFQSSPIKNLDHSILFTDNITQADLHSFQIILFRGQVSKIILKKSKSSRFVTVSGTDGKQEYSIIQIEEKNLSPQVHEFSNVQSQLTRPDIFPSHDRQNAPVPLWKISFTNEAQYSASPMKASELMVTDIIQNLNENGFHGKTISFLDGTANCGADTINSVFISNNLHFPFHVSAIELDTINYRALEENVALFGCESSVTSIQGNSVEWVFEHPEKSFDCMYFDPPWGGKDYKSMDKITLELNGINIWHWCKEIMDKSSDQLKLIVIKGPSNWNMNDDDLSTIKPLVKFKTFRNIIYAYINVIKYKRK